MYVCIDACIALYCKYVFICVFVCIWVYVCMSYSTYIDGDNDSVGVFISRRIIQLKQNKIIIQKTVQQLIGNVVQSYIHKTCQ